MNKARALTLSVRPLLLTGLVTSSIALNQACDKNDEMQPQANNRPQVQPAALTQTAQAAPHGQGQPASTQAPPAGRVPQGGAPITLDTFQQVASRVNAGVVNVSTSKIVRPSANPFSDRLGDDFMERFFGPRHPSAPDALRAQRQASLGSGFVIDDEGHVLTNRHVIAGADEIEIELPGGRQVPAKVIGRDARTDVALLKTEAAPQTTVLPLGESATMQPGEWVIAIGNPFGFGNSVTAGIVSYRGRPLPLGGEGTSVDMIQTDASINPGNSGGPLLNLAGEVVGINTLIVTPGLPQSAGVGFAVPIDVAKAILPQLRQTGRVVRGWLGVAVQALTPDLAKTYGLDQPKGAIVSDVTSGSPAEKADLEPGDVILSADGQPVEDGRELSDYVAAKKPGTTVQLRVLRDRGQKTVAVELGTFPEEDEEDASPRGARGGPLGMSLRPLAPQEAEQLDLPRTARGVVVAGVEVGKPAEEAGLRQGDVILSVNGTEVSDVSSFQQAVGQARTQGGLARLRVRRGTGFLFVALKVA